jgi:Ca2+-binding EF-hand superfamily protein
LRHSPLIFLAAGLLLAGCGGGQRQPPPWMRPAEKLRDENYHGGPVSMLTRYDANHDGVLTRDELIAGLKAEFAAHDVKHDGCLKDDQVDDINQSRVDADQSTATPLVDWNQDGCIDYTEFSAAPYSLFDQLDRNRDGKLTAQEMGQRVAPKSGDDAADADKPAEEPKPKGHHGGRRGGGSPPSEGGQGAPPPQ